MEFKVLIYGCGQIGSRHLESLLNVKYPLIVSIYDKSSNALSIAKNKLSQLLKMREEKLIHKIIFNNTLNCMEKEIDLVIIATNADQRIISVLQIKEMYNVKFWILEKVLVQSLKDLREIELLFESPRFAVVNTPRRMYSLYKKLKTQFKEHKILNVSFAGIDGLACNAIHFIDLVSYLSESDPISVDIEGLNDDWHESKRNGYYEIYGELIVNYKNKTELKISSKKNNSENIQAKIIVHDYTWNVDEFAKIAINNKNKIITGDCELQSQLTSKLVEEIITTNNCLSLPQLHQSIKQHEVLLKGLLKHWNKSKINNSKILPIT